MELLLLGLAGLGGLALMLQQKPLPSQEEAEKAFAVLDKDLLDPDANTVFGKYKAFVQGDYDAAMPYLVHSKDVALKGLAEHELDASHTATPSQKIGMGDEWVAAAKKFPALSRIFYDRAAQWYIKGWPDLDVVWKGKAREQGKKLAAARPPGVQKKGLPKGWADVGYAGNPPMADANVARTGSYSVLVPAPDPKTKNSVSALTSDLFPVEGKMLEASAYLLSDGTENASDYIFISFFDNAGNKTGTISSFYPVDVPFWNRVTLKGPIPANTVRAVFKSAVFSKEGKTWIDDVSVKVDGKEALKNGSFEDR